MIGLAGCLIYRLKIVMSENELRINDKLLDYELISIDDYSVKGPISESFYKDVVEATKPENEGEL